MKMKGISVEKQYQDLMKKKRKKPCVGLCFINKKKKLEKRKKMREEKMKRKLEKMEKQP